MYYHLCFHAQIRAALSARDDRLAHLHAELERTSDSLLASRHELRSAEEARRGLEEGVLAHATGQRLTSSVDIIFVSQGACGLFIQVISALHVKRLRRCARS